MVHIVGAGSGAPDLITLRGAELLRKAQVVIYAGSLVNPSLLGLCGPDCRLYNSAHLTLEEVLEVIRQATEQNQDVVRLHTGDPCRFGAIREQTDALDALGIGLIIPVLPRLIGVLTDTRDEQMWWYGAIMLSYGVMQFLASPLFRFFHSPLPPFPRLVLSTPAFARSFYLFWCLSLF